MWLKNIFRYLAFACFLSGITIPLPSCRNDNANGYKDGLHSSFDSVVKRAQNIADSGRYSDALVFLDSSYFSQRNPNTPDRFNYYALCYSVYHSKLQDQTQAILYADSMLAIAEKYADTRDMDTRYLSAYYTMGDLLISLGQYKAAYGLYYKAKKEASGASDSCTPGYYNYKLAMALYKQEQYKNAIGLFKLSLSEYGTCGNDFSSFFREQEIIDNIGLCYYKLRYWDSGIKQYELAISFIENGGKKFDDERHKIASGSAIGLIYGNMGSIYYTKGDTAKAEELFKKSIGINERKGYLEGDAQHTKLKLADLYFSKKNLRATLLTMQDLKASLDAHPYKEVEIGWYDLMWKYYQRENNIGEALRYFQNYERMKDSVGERMKIENEANVSILIGDMEQENEIGLLLKNNELKKNYLVAIVIATILSVVIVMLVLRNWKKARKDIRTLTDFNDRIKEQNNKLENVLTALEESNKEKDRVMRTVAHDIRNPVAAISSLTELLAADAEDLGPKVTDMLSFIKDACNEALTLSIEITGASDTGSIKKAGTEATDIQTLVANCVKMLSFTAKEKGQHILFSTENISATLTINKEEISRVVNNLISNAIKFSNKGAEIGVQLQQKKNDLIILVHDAGIGIPEEIKDAVFDVFTKAMRFGTAGEKPFGLGLSICKQIMLAHGGKIWFESVPGSGTSFYISFPITIR